MWIDFNIVRHLADPYTTHSLGLSLTDLRPSLADRPDFNPASHGLVATFSLSEYSDLKGRGCRVPSGVVQRMAGALGPPEAGNIGLGTDCSICPIRRGGLASISSSEMFYPLIDDPYMMGRIACVSLLSDLYALGVQEVDNILMYLGISAR